MLRRIKRFTLEWFINGLLIETPVLLAMDLHNKHIVIIIMRLKTLTGFRGQVYIRLDFTTYLKFKCPAEIGQFFNCQIKLWKDNSRPILIMSDDRTSIYVPTLECEIGFRYWGLTASHVYRGWGQFRSRQKMVKPLQ